MQPGKILGGVITFGLGAGALYFSKTGISNLDAAAVIAVAFFGSAGASIFEGLFTKQS